jgi:flagellar basal body P-ring formation chaperone FlgA
VSRFALALASLALMAAGSALALKSRASQPPIPLQASIVTRKDSVSLADFLPADVTGEPRSLVSEVALGKAPLPGEHRTFERAEVLRAITPVSGLAGLLEIPVSLEVTRWARRLAPDEIARAINESLSAGPSPSAARLAPEEIELPSEAMVAEAAPQFRIIRAEAAGHSDTRMQLWTVSEPGQPPFWVRVLRPISEFKSLGAMKGAAKVTHSGMAIHGGANSLVETPVVSPDAPLAVKAGAAVEVIVQGRGMRIATSGVALSPGREGQAIRVRTVPAGKILLGVLDEAGKVEINF